MDDGFAEYVAHRHLRLCRMAYLLARDWGTAEDLVQTALAKAWLAWRRIEGNPDPYVYRIIVNTHTSWWRRRWRGEVPAETLPETPDPRDAAAEIDDQAALDEPGGSPAMRHTETDLRRLLTDQAHQQGGVEPSARLDAIVRRGRRLRRTRRALTAGTAVVLVVTAVGLVIYDRPAGTDSVPNDEPSAVVEPPTDSASAPTR